jgi:hypothetical protein
MLPERSTLAFTEGSFVGASQDDGFISGIFLIPKRSGGYCPNLNLKGLNIFWATQKFKMEGISTVRHTI